MYHLLCQEFVKIYLFTGKYCLQVLQKPTFYKLNGAIAFFVLFLSLQMYEK